MSSQHSGSSKQTAPSYVNGGGTTMARPRASTATILAQIPSARAHAETEARAGRRAVSVWFDAPSGRVLFELSNGCLFGFPASSIPALSAATGAELATVELSPGGGALRWESLDVDL